VFRTFGRSADAMVIRFPHAMVFNLGVPPKQAYPGKAPQTRMGTASMVRRSLSEAAEYLRGMQNSDESKRPERNLAHEALGDVLNGKLAAMFCAQRGDDIQTALRLTREFNLQGVIALAAEGYLIAPQIAEARIPVIVHPTMQRVEDDETFRSYLGNAADLVDAGVSVAMGTGSEGYVPKTRVVRHEAAMAMVYGLGFDRALKAITIDAARLLKIDDEYGSLDVGKVADLVLYDGDPFEHATHVTQVFVAGRLAHDPRQAMARPLAERFYESSVELPCCLW
jgi:imidazolonepropionase-like amidohydrolase